MPAPLRWKHQLHSRFFFCFLFWIYFFGVSGARCRCCCNGANSGTVATSLLLFPTSTCDGFLLSSCRCFSRRDPLVPGLQARQVTASSHSSAAPGVPLFPCFPRRTATCSTASPASPPATPPLVALIFVAPLEPASLRSTHWQRWLLTRKGKKCTSQEIQREGHLHNGHSTASCLQARQEIRTRH